MRPQSQKDTPPATPLWMLVGLLLLVLVCALFAAYRHATAADLDAWTFRVLEVDRARGTATVRLQDLDAIVQSHNRQVKRIQRLEARTGCI